MLKLYDLPCIRELRELHGDVIVRKILDILQEKVKTKVKNLCKSGALYENKQITGENWRSDFNVWIGCRFLGSPFSLQSIFYLFSLVQRRSSRRCRPRA